MKKLLVFAVCLVILGAYSQVQAAVKDKTFNVTSVLNGPASTSKYTEIAQVKLTAGKSDLDGKSFSAEVVFNTHPYTGLNVKYACPKIIKKGKSGVCKMKFDSRGNNNSSNFTIRNMAIKSVDGKNTYSYKGDVVKGKITY